MSADAGLGFGDRFQDAPLFEAIREALETFGDDVRFACSFGVEDMIVLHEAARAAHGLGVQPRVFLLDTGRLHQETYDLLDRARARYRIAIEVYAPEHVAVEELVRTKGPNSFYASPGDRHECCSIRKLAPLRRALRGARAWVTGLRQAQAASRAAVSPVEVDEVNGGLLKLNPLARWTDEQVWAFAREHGVPTHALHSRGYPSIGCAPCTRAIEPGESLRAGRWWWEAEGHKECGLHARRGT